MKRQDKDLEEFLGLRGMDSTPTEN